MHLRWLLVYLACSTPSIHLILFVDHKPTARRADVDLPAAKTQTGQQVGSAGRDLEERPGGRLGWRRLAGASGLRCSPQLTQGQGRGHWQGNVWSHQPHIPQIIIMGRSTCARQRYEASSGVIPAPRLYTVTAPSAMSLLLAAKLLVHCQIPTVLPLLTSEPWLLFLETNPPPSLQRLSLASPVSVFAASLSTSMASRAFRLRSPRGLA